MSPIVVLLLVENIGTHTAVSPNALANCTGEKSPLGRPHLPCSLMCLLSAGF